MFWNAKNGRVSLNGATLPFVSFGSGPKKLVILPGLSDGLATVEGKALLLAKPYSHIFVTSPSICSAAGTRCRTAIPSGTWRRTRQRRCRNWASKGPTYWACRRAA